uniref:Transmembrane protein n=1 Tax=Meloidogyne hapla TaxID=6305 RepID=A0A1I8BKR6_MELHA
MNFGIFLCQIPNPQSEPNNLPLSDNLNKESEDSWKKSLNYCEQWFKLRSDWEKVVIIAMILAFLLSLIAFILNFFSFCSCACRLSILMRPLPLLAGLTFICLIIGLGLFWIKNQDYIAQIKVKVNDLDIDSLKSSAVDLVKFVNDLDEKTKGNNNNQGNVDNKVSYSFYLGCGAAVAAFANIVVGSLIVCFA